MVELDDDQSLPDNPQDACHIGRHDMALLMLEANFKKVKGE